MSWSQYQSKYRQFLISIHQAQITTVAAGSALESFPHNLPQAASGSLYDAMRKVAHMLGDALEKSNDPASNEDRRTLELPGDLSPVFYPMMYMQALRLKEGLSIDSIDFESVLYRQQLVMIIAHAEAFFGDTVRCICLARPMLLSSEQKQISWSAALSFHDRDALLSALSDSFAASMMQSKDITGFLAQLRKAIGLDVQIRTEHLKQLSLAEQVRHIIVHNGGLTDRKFLEKTSLNMPVSQPYVIDKKFIDDTTHACLIVAQSLFETVARNFFAIRDPGEGAGWRINDPAREE